MRKLIEDFGFYESNFSGSPKGYQSFYPKIHLTWKTRKSASYNSLWNRLVPFLESSSFKGYLEGEHIPTDDLIPYREFNEGHPFPFKVSTRPLKADAGELFRETEFHLCMDQVNSSPQLIQTLLDSGMIPVEIDKGDRGQFIIFTCQGFQEDINCLMTQLKDYLIEAGGAARCTLKEERIRDYALFQIDQTDLPEIIDTITV